MRSIRQVMLINRKDSDFIFSVSIKIKLDWPIDTAASCDTEVNATDSVLNLSSNANWMGVFLMDLLLFLIIQKRNVFSRQFIITYEFIPSIFSFLPFFFPPSFRPLPFSVYRNHICRQGKNSVGIWGRNLIMQNRKMLFIFGLLGLKQCH